MKSFRFIALTAFLALASLAFGQVDAKKSFDNLKALAGSWEGQVTTLPVAPDVNGKQMHVDLRVTSMGNALVHEMWGAGRPDHPVTMFYMDDDRLMLTHYCDAGNRPRMVSRISPDGKTIEFDFLDVAGSTQYGNMQHAVITIIDDNHHMEDWTFKVTGGKPPVVAHLDLQRMK